MNPLSAAETLRTLAARAEIHDLLASYCNRLDEYDIDGACAIFAEDVVTDYGPSTGGELAGRGALAARLSRTQAQYARTHHQIGQQEINIDGDEAHAMTYATAWHQRPDGTRAAAYVRYADRLSRRNGRWWVTRRQTFIAGVEGFAEEGFTWVPRRHA